MRCCPRFAVARYCSVVVVVLISASFRRYRPDHIVKACIVTLVLVHLSRALFNFSIHQQTTRRSTCVRTTLYTLCFTTSTYSLEQPTRAECARPPFHVTGRRSTPHQPRAAGLEPLDEDPAGHHCCVRFLTIDDQRDVACGVYM